MNASDKLKGDLSRDKARIEYGAWAVIAGLVVEIGVAALFHEQPFVARWATVFATALIALGVYVEIRYGHKADATTELLQQISEEKTAEANARAEDSIARTAEANLELARLKDKIAPRVLTPEFHEKLKALQGNVSELAVVWVSDSESAAFGWQIATALRGMGILVTIPLPDPVMVSAGLFALFPDSMNTFERKALSAILSGIGMTEMNRSWLSRKDINPSLIVVFVGQKPLEYPVVK
jgi:hypothetical protein